MKQLSVAICGCAGHAEKFAGIVNGCDGSQVTAVWDFNQSRGKALAELIGVPFEQDYSVLLERDRIDGVIIVAENVWHKPLIIQAARAGKSIFVEKPLCVSLQDAREIQKVVHETGVTFYMTDPFVRSGVLKVREMIRDGTLGDITGAHFQLASHAAYEKDESYPIYDRSLTLGGIVADSCGHMLHMAYFLFGKPNSLCAALAPVTSMAKKNKIEENAHIILRYSGGLLVVLDNSWVSGGVVKRIAVYGSEGNAFVTELSHIEGDENLKICRPDGSEQNLSGNDLPENPTQHVRYWLRMIHEGLPNSIVGQDPLSNSGVGIDSAVDLVEMIEAIYHSAEENCFVELT